MDTIQKFIESLVDTNGATFSLSSGTPTSGVFASVAGREHKVELSPVYNRYKRALKLEVIESEVMSYVNRHHDVLLQDGAHIGGWWENGQLVLDVSYSFDTVEQAAEFGILNGQRAIYSIDLYRVIDLPTGQTAGTHSQAAAYAKVAAQEIAKVNR